MVDMVIRPALAPRFGGTRPGFFSGWFAPADPVATCQKRFERKSTPRRRYGFLARTMAKPDAQLKLWVLSALPALAGYLPQKTQWIAAGLQDTAQQEAAQKAFDGLPDVKERMALLVGVFNEEQSPLRAWALEQAVKQPIADGVKQQWLVAGLRHQPLAKTALALIKTQAKPEQRASLTGQALYSPEPEARKWAMETAPTLAEFKQNKPFWVAAILTSYYTDTSGFGRKLYEGLEDNKEKLAVLKAVHARSGQGAKIWALEALFKLPDHRKEQFQWLLDGLSDRHQAALFEASQRLRARLDKPSEAEVLLMDTVATMEQGRSNKALDKIRLNEDAMRMQWLAWDRVGYTTNLSGA